MVIATLGCSCCRARFHSPFVNTWWPRIMRGCLTILLIEHGVLLHLPWNCGSLTSMAPTCSTGSDANDWTAEVVVDVCCCLRSLRRRAL